MDDPAPTPRSRRTAALRTPLPAAPIDGKYLVVGVLGEGGTGVVYDALRLGDRSPVALKVIHAHLAGDQQVRGRFQREATILRRLEGANICPILELGEVPSDNGSSLLYMALPKLDGPTLERVLEEERPIDVARGLAIMLEVCSALRTAHAQGVIHRDLKPANVILESGKKAVVVDFGMSKIVTGAAGGTTNLTAHNMVFGTPEYMSPEQARGDELDARCDIYAAGIMLYEMLTGAPPFTGSTPLNVLTEHLTGDIELPSKRAGSARVTPALESVVMHSLARDRELRYPSAAALAAAIMHARAAPQDVTSLRPTAFATSPEGTDAYALTMPAIGVADELPLDDKVPSDTIPALSPLPSMPVPSTAPVPKPSAGTPSKTPSKAPSSRPRSPEVPLYLPAARHSSTRMWILIWVLAGLASMGAGVYFALR